MDSHKRKYDDLDSDDDDPTLGGGRQILPVANLPIDFSGDPEDGAQYLFTVRRDSRCLPHVTRVMNPYELPESRALKPSTSAAIHAELPSVEWRQTLETRFKNFRKNITQPTIHVQSPPEKLIPNMRERDHWWAFIQGRPESEWNRLPKETRTAQYSKRSSMRGFPDEDEIDSTSPSGSAEDERRVVIISSEEIAEMESSADTQAYGSTKIRHREPTPTLISLIDNKTALHLLMYFEHWISRHLDKAAPDKRITNVHTRWMFALLSQVDEHVFPDDMSLLRQLARSILALLKKQIQGKARDGPEEISKSDCWIIFTVIARVWAQHDLWVDAEDVFAIKIE